MKNIDSLVTKQEGEDSVLKQIQQWMKDLPCRTIARQPCGTDCLSPQAIDQISKSVSSLEVSHRRSILVNMSINH